MDERYRSCKRCGRRCLYEDMRRQRRGDCNEGYTFFCKRCPPSRPKPDPEEVARARAELKKIEPPDPLEEAMRRLGWGPMPI